MLWNVWIAQNISNNRHLKGVSSCNLSYRSIFLLSEKPPIYLSRCHHSNYNTDSQRYARWQIGWQIGWKVTDLNFINAIFNIFDRSVVRASCHLGVRTFSLLISTTRSGAIVRSRKAFLLFAPPCLTNETRLSHRWDTAVSSMRQPAGTGRMESFERSLPSER